MPCEILSREGDFAVQDKFQTPILSAPAHPAFLPLGQNEASFEHARVRAWFKTKLHPSLHQTQTLLTLAPSNDPLVYERSFGRGVLFVVTTPLTTRWSDFPLHPIYALWLRGMADAMRAAQAPPLNLKVGEPIEGRFEFDARGAEHALKAPDRHPEKLQARKRLGRDFVKYENTAQPGCYEMISEKEGRKESAYYCVNPETQESDLTPVSEKDMETAISLLNAKRVGAWDDLENLFKRARQGLELWWLFFGLTIFFVFLELALARYFQRSFVDETMLRE